jgi:hypothetical protein
MNIYGHLIIKRNENKSDNFESVSMIRSKTESNIIVEKLVVNASE